jgi:hypothetical protein
MNFNKSMPQYSLNSPAASAAAPEKLLKSRKTNHSKSSLDVRVHEESRRPYSCGNPATPINRQSAAGAPTGESRP